MGGVLHAVLIHSNASRRIFCGQKAPSGLESVLVFCRFSLSRLLPCSSADIILVSKTLKYICPPPPNSFIQTSIHTQANSFSRMVTCHCSGWFSPGRQRSLACRSTRLSLPGIYLRFSLRFQHAGCSWHTASLLPMRAGLRC